MVKSQVLIRGGRNGKGLAFLLWGNLWGPFPLADHHQAALGVGDRCAWSAELNNAVYLGSSWRKFYIDLRRICKWAQSSLGGMMKCCFSRMKGRQVSPPTKDPDEGIRKTSRQHSRPFNWWGRLLPGPLKSFPSFKSSSLSCVSSIFTSGDRCSEGLAPPQSCIATTWQNLDWSLSSLAPYSRL